MSSYDDRFVNWIGVVFHATYISKTKSVTPQSFCISDIGNSLSDCNKSIKKMGAVEDFRGNVLKGAVSRNLAKLGHWELTTK